MPSFLYWRVPIFSGTPQIAELAFFDSGGTSLATGGTPSASSTSGTNAAANAFDGNASTFWQASSSASSSNPQWIQYQFASAVAVDHFTITSPTSFSNTPTSFDLYGSNDGATWTDVGKNYTATWTAAGQTQTFSAASVNPNARLTQIARESLQAGGNPNARLTQLARESLQAGGNPNARLTQIAREVLVILPSNTQPIVFVVT